MQNRYDLPVSTDSPKAAAAYLAAVDNLLLAGGSLAAGFEAALAHDNRFALAEIARARCLQIHGQSQAAQQASSQAQQWVQGATRRERQHVAALALVIAGKGEQALAAILQHLEEFPGDALVLQPATMTFGLIGFSGRPVREAEFLALMRGLAPQCSGDWWFDTVHAFAEGEAGDALLADRLVTRALQQQPLGGNAAHVRSHLLYELQQPHEGIAFTRDFLARYPADGLLRGHLAWHGALCELAVGNAEAGWGWYEAEIAPALRLPSASWALPASAYPAKEGAVSGPEPVAYEPITTAATATATATATTTATTTTTAPVPPLNVLTDAASWLWRASLTPIAATPERLAAAALDWQRLVGVAQQRFPNAGLPFADLHSAMAYAATDNAAALANLLAQLQTLASARPVCAATHDLCQGLAAFSKGDMVTAVPLLTARLGDTIAVGGSRAQRDLIEGTVLAALRTAVSDWPANATQSLLATRPQLHSLNAAMALDA